MQDFIEAKKKDTRKILKNNILVFFLFLFFVIVFIFDLGNKNFLNQNEIVGIVKSKIKNAQKKEIVSGAWTDLTVNTKLLNYDTIVTESLSQLDIELKDGTNLTLSENSMIIIDYKNDNININFEYGNLKMNSSQIAKTDKKIITITTDTKVIIFNKSVLTLHKDSIAKTEVRLEEGTATIRTNELNKEIVAGDVAKIFPLGKIELGKELVKLINPISNRYYYSDTEEKKIDFEWKENKETEGNENYLQIYDTNKPSKPIVVKKVSNESEKINLREGSYQWKIFTKNKSVTSDTMRFFVIKAEKPLILNPKHNSILYYQNNLPRIDFSWNIRNIDSISKLIISEKENFEPILKEITVNQKNTIIDNLADGNYFFKVVSRLDLPEYPDQTSMVTKFSVKKQIDTIPLILTSPANNQNFSFEPIKKDFNFSWEKNPQAISYRFTIAKDHSLTQIISKKETIFPLVKIQLPDSGKYFWNIIGIDKSGKPTLISKVYSFNISEAPKKLSLKKPIPKFSTNDPDLSLEFSWEGQKDSNYILEIDKTKNFTNPRKWKTKETKILVSKLPFDTNFWRVIKEFGKSKLKVVSETREIKVSKIPELKILKPKDNSVLDLSNLDEIVIQWEKIPDVTSYNLEIRNLDTNKEIIKKSISQSNIFIEKDFKKFTRNKYIAILSANIRLNSGKDILKTTKQKFRIVYSNNIIESDLQFTSPEEEEILK